jgi:hypothetical protein
MATTIYLTNSASDIDPGGAGEEALEARVEVRGAGLSTGTTDTIASGSNIVCTRNTTSDIELAWYTRPLDAVTIASFSTVTQNLWMAESNMSANVQASCFLDHVDGAGTVIAALLTGATPFGVELPVTTRAAQNWGANTGTAGTLSTGDRLRIRAVGTNTGTMAAGHTFSIGFAGVTASADGDTWLQFTQTIVEQSVAPPRYPAVNFQDPGLMMQKLGAIWKRRPRSGLYLPEFA